jgi:hypothetical protein
MGRTERQERRRQAEAERQEEQERTQAATRERFETKVSKFEGLTPAELRRMAIEAIVKGESDFNVQQGYYEAVIAYGAKSIALSNLALLGVALEQNPQTESSEAS